MVSSQPPLLLLSMCIDCHIWSNTHPYTSIFHYKGKYHNCSLHFPFQSFFSYLFICHRWIFPPFRYIFFFFTPTNVYTLHDCTTIIFCIYFLLFPVFLFFFYSLFMAICIYLINGTCRSFTTLKRDHSLLEGVFVFAILTLFICFVFFLFPFVSVYQQ